MPNSISRRVRAVLVGVGAVLTLAISASAPAAAPGNPITQIAGVDNSRMGAYRALAQLSFQAFQKGDLAMAAELARILERTWDAAEEGGGPKSLVIRNKDLFEQLDKAMDTFIKPILRYTTKSPAPDAVEHAYKDFLEKLKQGDESPT